MRFAVALALAVTACSDGAAPAKPPARPSAYVQVLDGGTLIVRGETVRIANVDAPRLPPDAACSAEAALGVQSVARLRSMIDHAPSLRLERTGKDRQGHTVARVILRDDNDVGEALVFAGVAAEWQREPWDWCGPADYSASGGPAFVSGPEDNKTFLTWLVDRMSADALNEAR